MPRFLLIAQTAIPTRYQRTFYIKKKISNVKILSKISRISIFDFLGALFLEGSMIVKLVN